MELLLYQWQEIDGLEYEKNCHQGHQGKARIL